MIPSITSLTATFRITIPDIKGNYAQCLYTEGSCAECLYTEGSYIECLYTEYC
jgi:hypothetical protein